MLSARPKWNDVLERPGKVISGMGIDGLEKTEGDPNVDGDYMQVWLEPAVEKRPENSSRSEDHDFERMCVFRSETEGRGIFVMELVNMFVEQGCVEELMGEIVEHVLEEKEECELRDHGLPRWERHLPSAHAKGLSDGVEEEDGGPLNGKVRKEDPLDTLPLLLWCRHLRRLQLPLAEVRD